MTEITTDSMSSRRYISAGTWIRVQDFLGRSMKVLVTAAVLLSPLLAIGTGIIYGLRTGAVIGFAFAAIATVVSIWLFLVVSLIEPVRINGLPYIER